MKVSSVSPERCEITHRYPASRAIWIASSVSVSVPIWLSLIRIEFAIPRSIPSRRIAGFLTKMSSPTSCSRSPRRSVSSFQPSQSCSAIPVPRTSRRTRSDVPLRAAPWGNAPAISASACRRTNPRGPGPPHARSHHQPHRTSPCGSRARSLHSFARQRHAGTDQLGGALLDLDPSLREMPQHRIRNTLEFDQAPAGRSPHEPR
jgi:hypothetical protein